MPVMTFEEGAKIVQTVLPELDLHPGVDDRDYFATLWWLSRSGRYPCWWRTDNPRQELIDRLTEMKEQYYVGNENPTRQEVPVTDAGSY